MLVFLDRRVRKEIMAQMVCMAARETVVHREIADQKDQLEMMDDLACPASSARRFAPAQLIIYRPTYRKYLAAEMAVAELSGNVLISINIVASY